MSSPSEAAHATGGEAVLRDFDLLEVLRTPYRIDILQPVYFVIDGFGQLGAALDADLAETLDRARAEGELPPRFDVAA